MINQLVIWQPIASLPRARDHAGSRLFLWTKTDGLVRAKSTGEQWFMPVSSIKNATHWMFEIEGPSV